MSHSLKTKDVHEMTFPENAVSKTAIKIMQKDNQISHTRTGMNMLAMAILYHFCYRTILTYTTILEKMWRTIMRTE